VRELKAALPILDAPPPLDAKARAIIADYTAGYRGPAHAAVRLRRRGTGVGHPRSSQPMAFVRG
jgi:hypothetical protein